MGAFLTNKSGGGSSATTVIARASTATAGSYPDAAATIIDFSTVAYDTASAITTGASWHYTAPSTGYYQVGSAILTGTQAGSGSMELVLYVNTSRFCMLSANLKNSTVIAQRFVMSGTTQLSLTAGDTVDIRLLNNSGSTCTLINDATYNWVCVQKVGA